MNPRVFNDLLNPAMRPDWRATEKNIHAIGPDYTLSRVCYRIIDTVGRMAFRRSR